MSTEPQGSLYPCPDCGQLRGIGSWPHCPHGTPRGGLRIASIHPSERTVIYRNQRTGERRVPAVNNVPIPEVYARQGYVREELDTPAKVTAYEKETGAVHERSWYDPGSGAAERALEPVEPTLPKSDELTRRLVQAIS